MIPDEDNWFHRFNKLAWQIFGREISREEFRKHFVGVQPFRMVEILSDHGEAVGNVEYAQMGRRAKNENWIGQIEALKKERDNVLYPYVNGISGAAEVPVNANPDGLNAAIQAIKAKDTKIEELGRALEILQKGGGSGIDAETKADIGAIKATVEWIKNLLSKVFKGDA